MAAVPIMSFRIWLRQQDAFQRGGEQRSLLSPSDWSALIAGYTEYLRHSGTQEDLDSFECARMNVLRRHRRLLEGQESGEILHGREIWLSPAEADREWRIAQIAEAQEQAM